ncbi:MAG: hypothetical protein JO037_19555 [Actinobacteria bacterium]|nr:hypothetical protein [Actinomycetota bacterium]
MNHLRGICAALAALVGAVLALAAAPALAEPLPPPDCCGTVQAPVTVLTGGGMPGWQITLIAVGAALVAATLAVLLDRAWAARKARVATA